TSSPAGSRTISSYRVVRSWERGRPGRAPRESTRRTAFPGRLPEDGLERPSYTESAGQLPVPVGQGGPRPGRRCQSEGGVEFAPGGGRVAALVPADGEHEVAVPLERLDR